MSGGAALTIAVFGATGRTGLPLLEQAVRAGHTVRVLVRDPDKLNGLARELVAVRGDAYRELERVEETIRGAEAVVSVVGPGPQSPPDLLRRVAANLVDAMRKYRVRRLLYMAGVEVLFPRDRPRVGELFRCALHRVMAHRAYQDQAGGVATVTQSGLDWTVIRGPVLVDGPASADYRVGHLGDDLGARATRSNIAHFFLRELEERRHIGDGPVICDGGAAGRTG